MSKTNKIFIPILDSLRGLAALLVVLFHFICTTIGFIDNELILDIFSFGKYGVQIFFVISGIVIPLSMINAGYRLKDGLVFFKKRIIRIEPPYMVSILLVCGVIYLKMLIPGLGAEQELPESRNLLLHLGYLVPFFEGSDWINTVYWTLAIEFQYYFAMSILFPIAISKGIYLRIVFYVLFLAPVFLFGDKSFFPVWGPLFMLGIIYVLYITKKVNWIELAIVFALSSFLIFNYLGITDLVFGVSTILLVHFFKEFKSRIGSFFGNISYSLYLTHSIIGAAVVNFLSHRVESSFGKLLVVAVGLVVAVSFAYLMYVMVELRFKKMAKSIAYRKKNSVINKS